MVDTEIGDKIVIMNPWTLRLLLVAIFFIGVFIGTILVSLLIFHGIEVVGESFKVENITTTISINDTIIKDAMKPYYALANDTVIKAESIDTNSRWYVNETDVKLAKEYDRGFLDGISSFNSNILFAGSTFTYDNKYVVKAWDMTPKRAEIVIMQDGNEIDRGFCFSNRWCNINNVSFQIDDIHIGKEAAYFVYWSDK